ncbi:mitotic spindle assembly checkpoint protein MAD2A-like [Anneissia japonica]|uniref:mitotic spindle assembly checkpoint protein MAD2A-like n=1 Tax=Anneissia japonica TaxID=1529436 RepID=UPI0014258A61|nr:mitotic spindle assembly checkpoint protein MAD2A-like [Anneissia japonica]
MTTKQAGKSKITLKGSSEIVAEFFFYGINSILYQRGIYPTESFSRSSKYNLTMWTTTDEDLKNYLNNIVTQLKEWLTQKTVQKLVLVVTSLKTNEVLERWQFDVECDKTMNSGSKPKEKSLEEINRGIRDVIRQITATVTFLPLLEAGCVFDLLIYTDMDQETPETWEESGPRMIVNCQEVRLRSFTTSVHKVDAMVCYKNDD